jgi:hypothetical protein
MSWSKSRRLPVNFTTWALLAADQIKMGTIDGWQTLAFKLTDQTIDLAA